MAAGLPGRRTVRLHAVGDPALARLRAVLSVFWAASDYAEAVGRRGLAATDHLLTHD
jgi:hypothetical protein